MAVERVGTPHNNPALVSHLPSTSNVVRVIRTRSWLDESGRITTAAFMRDAGRDPDGLSVGISEKLNDEQALTLWVCSILKKSFGADLLNVGRIAAVNLDVGQTEKDLEQGSAHALIVGIPTQDENPDQAEAIATALVEMSARLDRIVRDAERLRRTE